MKDFFNELLTYYENNSSIVEINSFTYNTIYGFFKSKKYDLVDLILSSIKPEDYELGILVGILGVASQRKSELICYPKFLELVKIKAELKYNNVNDVKKLLNGFEI